MDSTRSADELRKRKERLAEAHRNQFLREERKRQSEPIGGLLAFIRYFWHVLEPVDPFVEGWPLECLCAHLEAITRGETIAINGVDRPFNRFLGNVSPGFMKSLTVNVFWCAWEWGPMGLPHLRYVAFSYAAELTERDNAKFGDLICSDAYRELWGHVFKVIGDGKVRVTNDKTGFKFASSIGGIGTGERGHRVLCLAGDQKVLTERGPVPIVDLVEKRTNCRAWSYNEKSGRFELKPIVGWHKNPGRPLVRITTERGASIVCTHDHEIYTSRGMRLAAALGIGDQLLTASGDWQTKVPPSAPCANVVDSPRAHAKFDFVQSIDLVHDVPSFTYCITVEGNHTMLCGGEANIVTKQCDDIHKVKGQQETAEARKSVTDWVLEGMQNRLNDLTRDAIVVIMQRLHEEDTSGVIQKKLGAEYCTLIIPMEYESNRHFSHYTGWNAGQDPRTQDGELAWPARYPREAMASFQANTYLWSGQYQQNPVPRGGGLFKEEWWQVHRTIAKEKTLPNGKTVITGYDFKPEVQPLFVLASLDTAFSEKEENDFSALTVWVVHDHIHTKHRNILLVDAWQKRLPHLHGEVVEKEPGESPGVYRRRSMEKWGLVEWVADTCKRRGVHRLIIENKNRGPDVVREIKRLYADQDWSVQAIDVRGDKWSRAHAVVDLFTDGMIYIPAEVTDSGDVHYRDWASEMIREISTFPRGAHDDLLDSMSLALKNLRDTGWAIRKDERRAIDTARATFKGASRPAIYQV